MQHATEALMQIGCAEATKPPVPSDRMKTILLRHTNILVCAAIGKKIYVLYVGISSCKGLLYFSERK